MSEISGVPGLLFPPQGSGDTGNQGGSGGPDPVDSGNDTGGAGSTGSGGTETGGNSGGGAAGGSGGSTTSGASAGSDGLSASGAGTSETNGGSASAGAASGASATSAGDEAAIRFRAESPVGDFAPRRTAIERLFGVDQDLTLASLVKPVEPPPTPEEQSSKFIERLAELRAASNNSLQTESRAVLAPANETAEPRGVSSREEGGI